MSKKKTTKQFIEEDLIDALYKACIYSKENRNMTKEEAYNKVEKTIEEYLKKIND